MVQFLRQVPRCTILSPAMYQSDRHTVLLARVVIGELVLVSVCMCGFCTLCDLTDFFTRTSRKSIWLFCSTSIVKLLFRCHSSAIGIAPVFLYRVSKWQACRSRTGSKLKDWKLQSPTFFLNHSSKKLVMAGRRGHPIATSDTIRLFVKSTIPEKVTLSQTDLEQRNYVRWKDFRNYIQETSMSKESTPKLIVKSPVLFLICLFFPQNVLSL